MFHNHFIITVRNFLRHPISSIINVTGLVLGLTCSIFIFLWVLDELSFDRYHKDNDRVYKVMGNEFFSDGTISTYQFASGILAEALKSEFPEVEQTCRLNWSNNKVFKVGQKSNYEYGVYADKSIFEVLNLPLVDGNPNNVLPDNHSVAISKKMAIRFFNSYNVVGSTFRVDNNIDLTVTAVFDDIPDHATVDFNFVVPFEIYLKESNTDIYRWENEGWIITYLKLKAKEMRPEVDKKIRSLAKRHNKNLHEEHFLFPMTEWRLYDQFENGKQAGGRISYVISFSLVAILTLIIACINFMNLSTARSASRSKEVGIRKVAGSSRNTLIRQFMTESILLSLFSLLVALLLVHLLLPVFNDFTGKKLTINYLNPVIPGALLLITLFTGFLAGSYPAIFLSSFRPATVLKGNTKSDYKGSTLRKSLVVFQFGLSMIIIICALVVNDQTAYMRNKNLGFDKNDIISVWSNVQTSKNYEAFRNELLQQPDIIAVGMGAANPMEINGSTIFKWEGKPSDDDSYFNSASCDYDYLSALGFTLIEGRNFSRNFPSDSTNYIITEGAARKIGFANPIGRHMQWGNHDGQIIGVIKDFHNLGIRESLRPTVFTLGNRDADFGRWATVFVRYKSGRTITTLEHISDVYKKYTTDFPIQFGFLDKDFEWQFHAEIMAATLTKCFTVMAVIISCLGLFGLALFNTEKRMKEISIRKVLGASVSRLVVLLCSDFVKLVFYAIIISCPIAYYLTEKFLGEYAYHIQINIWMFVLPSLVMFLSSLIIISYQSIKASLRNPVDAMRSE